MVCKKCGDCVAGKNFCSRCGERVEIDVFCSTCGNCVTGKIFCRICGTAVGVPQAQEGYGNIAGNHTGIATGAISKKKMSTGSKVLIGAAGFVVFAIIVVVTILFSGITTERPLTAAELLEVAERYLLEGNYEQALIEFMRVIQVDPMEPRGYTGAAEAYIGLDSIYDALDVLHQGLDVLPDNPEVLQVLSVVEDILAPDYIISRIASITVHSVIEQDAWRIAYAEHLRNYPLTRAWGEYLEPIFALIDINNDGMPELFISYNIVDQNTWFNIYTFDNTSRTVVHVGGANNHCPICAWVVSNNPDFPGLFLCNDPASGVGREFISKSNNQIDIRYVPLNSSLHDVYWVSRNEAVGAVIRNHDRNEYNIQNIIFAAELATLQFNVHEQIVPEEFSGVSAEFRVKNINGIDHFNIRDIAYILSDTENEFSVSTDGGGGFSILVGKPYVSWDWDISRNVDQQAEWEIIKLMISVAGEEEWIATSLYRNGSFYFRRFDIYRMLGIEIGTLPPVQNPTTVFAGMDFALVFDVEFYRNNNLDVAEVFGDDAIGILTHFVNNGMSEGRIAHPNFNVHVYRAHNPDLEEAFGDDLRSYFLHYIHYGHREGRIASE